MKPKRILSAVLTAAILMLVFTLTAAADDDVPEDTLVIEAASFDAEPGDIIEIPVIVTSNPGVSVIKELRIDLRRGLNLYFPQGKDAYDNRGTADTWPYEPAQKSSGGGEGMLPVMGRPTAGNISENHIVFQFLDASLPFDSTATGTIITLMVQVSDNAEGEIPVVLSGGMYGNMKLDGDKEPVLQNGYINAGGDEEIPIPNSQDQQEDPVSQPIPVETITEALKEDEPYIKLTSENETLIPAEAVQEIIDAGKPVTVEFADGTIVILNPSDIPAASAASAASEASAGFDLKDIYPQEGTVVQTHEERGAGPVPAVVIILLSLGFIAAGGTAVIAFVNLPGKKTH